MKGRICLGLVIAIVGAPTGASAADLKLDCGTEGIVTGIDGFKVVKMPDGQIVRGVGGETRTFPDGVRMSAVPYSDGSVLYTKASKPVAFFFQKAGGPMVKCEIP